MHSKLALVALLLTTTACSGGAAVEASLSSSTSRTITVDIRDTTVVTIDGVRIDIERDVSTRVPLATRVSIVTASGKSEVESHQEGPDVYVRGHVLDVADGRLSIGSDDFGAVDPTSEIRVSAAGVFVDGDRRGDVPAASGG